MRMLSIALLLVTILFGCSRRDPIDRLMEEIPYQTIASYPFQPIKLPKTATADQLLSALIDRGYFRQKKITDIVTLEVRAVHTMPLRGYGLPVEYYTAVLLNTSAGQKIMLFRPLSDDGWYYKIYDAK